MAAFSELASKIGYAAVIALDRETNAMLLVLLSLIPACFCSFAFNNLRVVRAIGMDVAEEFQCGCLVVLEPTNATADQKTFVQRLTFTMARGHRHHKMAKQINLYTFQQYTFYYTHEAHLKAGSCFKTLNIAMVTEATATQLTELSRSHLFPQSIWLLFTNGSISPFSDTVNLWFNSGVWVVRPEGAEYALWEAYRVSPSYPIRLVKDGAWHPIQGLNLTQTPKPVRRNDLEGLVMRAGAIEGWPSATFVRGNAGKERVLDGFFPNIWYQLEELMNFTSIAYKSVDGSPGSVDETGNWTGLIGMLLQGEIDVIISELDFSSSRLDVVQHLLPLQKTRCQVYYRLVGYVIDWASVLKPFSALVWHALIAWLALSAACMYISNVLSEKNGLPPAREVTFVNSLFFVLQAVCFQGTPSVPRVWASRLVFLVSYLFAAVIVPAYSASLVSSLTTKTPLKPFDSLEDMLYTNYRLLVGKRTARFEYFKNTQDPILQAVNRKLVVMVPNESINTTDFYSALQYTCNNSNVAMFSGETEMDAQMRYGHMPCDVVKFTTPLSLVHQSMAFAKRSPYRDTANYYIIRMSESGLIDRLERMYFPRWRPAPAKPDIPVFIRDVAEVFAFLALAHVGSFAILVAELVYRSRYKTLPFHS